MPKETELVMSMSFDMVMTCITVIVLILLMFIIFLRRKQKPYAFSTLPLVIVPLFYLIGGYVAQKMANHVSAEQFNIHAGFIATALIIACVLIGVASRGIASVSRRIIFLVMSMLFAIVFAWILMLNLPYSPI